MGLAPELVERFAAVTDVIREPEQLRTYECDGLTGRRVIPALVALPGTTAEVQAVVRHLQRSGDSRSSPAGPGTGLSGGALPSPKGSSISLARMTAVLEIDVDAGYVVVEPGVDEPRRDARGGRDGFYYAPDPSSQQVCTIGGNVAENSGGAHCLKYGFTVNHVLAAEIVLPDGELVELSVWDEGPDLLGGFVGSEGTLGIATKLTLRVLRAPEAVRTLLAGFAHTDDAGAAVSGDDRRRDPARGDRDDGRDHDRGGRGGGRRELPAGCGAMLIVELDGPVAQVEEDLARVEALCRANGAREIRIASDPADRAAVWRGRKAAFAAMGRVSPDYYVQDGVVPRTKLPAVLRRIDELSRGARPARRQRLPRRRRQPASARALRRARRGRGRSAPRSSSSKILEACVDAGGSITGEHGVGADKACAMPLMFSEDDLEAMQRLRTRVRPARAREPRQALPDAAPLRRGARAVSRASAREGRTCRAVLSVGSSSTSPAT